PLLDLLCDFVLSRVGLLVGGVFIHRLGTLDGLEGFVRLLVVRLVLGVGLFVEIELDRIVRIVIDLGVKLVSHGHSSQYGMVLRVRLSSSLWTYARSVSFSASRRFARSRSLLPSAA